MASVTNYKKRKRSTEVVSNDVDRISNLPESIISHILSLLPTEDAVATSFLSKKWKLLWRDIYNLSFDDTARHFRQYHKREEHNSLFSFFVNKVLFYLDRKCIDKFSLHVKRFSADHYVNLWIDIVVSRNPRVIQVDGKRYREDYSFDMPRSLYTCETLEVLNLSGEIDFNVPNVVSLPNLKTLHIDCVTWDKLECLLKLISACSSLENVYVQRVDNSNEGPFTISSPTLRSFTLDFTYDVYFPGEELTINAPQLRYLELSNKYLVEDLSLENLCLLDEAKLKLSLFSSELCLLDYNIGYSIAIVKLFQGIYNVQKLSLMGDELEALSHVDFSPIFLRLSHLTIPPTCWTQSLLNILECSKKLESLTILKDDYDYDYDIRMPWTRWSKPEKVPINLFSCLKTVSFKGIEGLADELAMVAYILENAKLLKTITIQPYSFLDTKARLKLLQKISKIHRGSVKCELHFL